MTIRALHKIDPPEITLPKVQQAGGALPSQTLDASSSAEQQDTLIIENDNAYDQIVVSKSVKPSNFRLHGLLELRMHGRATNVDYDKQSGAYKVKLRDGRSFKITFEMSSKRAYLKDAKGNPFFGDLITYEDERTGRKKWYSLNANQTMSLVCSLGGAAGLDSKEIFKQIWKNTGLSNFDKAIKIKKSKPEKYIIKTDPDEIKIEESKKEGFEDLIEPDESTGLPLIAGLTKSVAGFGNLHFKEMPLKPDFTPFKQVDLANKNPVQRSGPAVFRRNVYGDIYRLDKPGVKYSASENPFEIGEKINPQKQK